MSFQNNSSIIYYNSISGVNFIIPEPLGLKAFIDIKNRAPPQILYNVSYHTNITDWRDAPMSIIRQQSLFDMHELYEMEPTHRFNAIFSTINLEPIWALFEKKTNVGAPRELNYGAMVYSLIARVVERIPTIKDLVKRLKHDPFFRFDCGFLHSDKFHPKLLIRE